MACKRGAIRCLTPHPGEAAGLLHIPVSDVQANRLAALRELSHRYGGCWVVLKGHQTLVGRETGEVFVNSSGNPHLAQGGSGDVLAGFIGGLLAQPGLQTDAGKALRYAVWQHGAAADALQARRRNWVVEDLFSEIGDVSPNSIDPS
jgi:NAD(P)H-hydrate epimerase